MVKQGDTVYETADAGKNFADMSVQYAGRIDDTGVFIPKGVGFVDL